jgi:hypothetical protein
MFSAILIAMSLPASPQLAFWKSAPTPPMGWNSWDCFATTVTEAQTRAQADVMAAKLKPFGWRYVVVDIQWYEPKAASFEYRQGAALTLDEFGRLLPAPNRFPSAADGKGFGPLADYVHRKGLKFGIHLMRGIPRQAVEENLPIKDTPYRAKDIADMGSTCRWNPDMYGVDMSKPGAQRYYDSVFDQFATWGVDFVKVDDIARPYAQAEIEAIRRAIDRTGRRIVLSLSPGETPLDAASHVSAHANMWRISDDFWDSWPALVEQFERCRKWATITGPGHFPDADMLPLGKVRFGEQSHLTHPEQVTMLTLWCIFRSPLMLGCDLTKLDNETLSLITNPEIIAVDQKGHGGRQIERTETSVVWAADGPKRGEHVVALFNLGDAPQTVSLDLAQAGLFGEWRVRDLWRRQDGGAVSGHLSVEVVPHGAEMFLLRR